jgi:hypothetical protein
MTRTRLAAFVGAGLLVSGLSWSAAQEEQPQKATSKTAEAAKEAYAAFETMYQVGKATTEDVYVWSRRWMDAELKNDPMNKQAVEDHWKRMRELHMRVATLHRAGVAGGEASTLAAAEYYLAEAAAEYGR